MEKDIAYYDDVANLYFNIDQEQDAKYEFMMPNFLEVLGDVKGKSVIDLGCGNGSLTKILRSQTTE